MDYILLLRPKQWVKNFFVYAALIFSRNAFDPLLLGVTTAAFALFCLLSGGVYVLNDICDRERDRLHPVKCGRPVASGRVPVGTARVYAAALLGGGIFASFAVTPLLGIVAVAYTGLMIAYTLWLKEQVILDVFSIAAGFILRVVAGVAATGVSLSPWLILCTLFLSLFLALGKRRHELYLLKLEAQEHRPALDHYSFGFIDQMVSIVTSATVLSYSLYTFLAPTSRLMMLTIPLVLYGMFRYLYVIYRANGGGAPEDVLMNDLPLQVTVLLWIAACLLILYLGGTPGQPVVTLY
ncbi:MAG TPA: decaprenyl-phosphate phosphoribosyltransferase [Syntrophomonadaceae bacterium]|nr:decaprenyl-phosphate phosphoribosyltransferase [Syntrophomonadaceae bacterium]